MSEEKSSWLTQHEFAPTTIARQLLESWRNHEYRAEFVRERVKSSIALQIRSLREQRDHMTQTQLGDAIGMAQTWISKLENPDYGKMTIATLLRLAEAFDSDLEVKFRPFSRGLHDLSRQSTDYFIVPSFDQELLAMESYVERGATVDALPPIEIAQAFTQPSTPPVSAPYLAGLFETLPVEHAASITGGLSEIQASLAEDMTGIHLLPLEHSQRRHDRKKFLRGMRRNRLPKRSKFAA